MNDTTKKFDIFTGTANTALAEADSENIVTFCLPNIVLGWGGWIRTNASRDQNPLPYRLATPHSS